MPRKKKKEDDVNTNAWMDTYADTITLLLTFFILLYSISAVDTQKLNELSKALQWSLKGTEEVTKLESLEALKVEISEDKNTKYEYLAQKLNEIIKENGLADVIKTREEDRGIVLQLDEDILFDSGEAKLKENSKIVLDAVVIIILETDNEILVEGHTDDVPIYSTEFESNWELSTKRAVNVSKHFIDRGIDPARFSVKGYGEYNPLVPNDTRENKAINRRVDILVIEEKVNKDK